MVDTVLPLLVVNASGSVDKMRDANGFCVSFVGGLLDALSCVCVRKGLFVEYVLPVLYLDTADPDDFVFDNMSLLSAVLTD